MNSLLDVIDEYSYKAHKQIKQLSQPLTENFGVDKFDYVNVHDDGRFWGFSDDLAWAEYFANVGQKHKHNLMANSPLITHPDNLTSGIFTTKILSYIPHYAEFNQELSKMV